MIHLLSIFSHSIAADQEGRLWVWGRNTDGELGLGDFVRRNEPTVVTRLLHHWISKVIHVFFS